MNRMDAITWVLMVCAPYLHRRRSQAKTLGQLVVAGMSCLRISMPALGRAMRGRLALRKEHSSAWSSSSKNDCSLFTIGRVMLCRLCCTPSEALREVLRSLATAAGSWG